VADTNGDGVNELVSSPNASTATAHYTVVYPFTGFKAPVANPPDVNPVKAGQAVPIKFSLGGDRGLRILTPPAPTSRPIACPSGPAGDPVLAFPAGNSGAPVRRRKRHVHLGLEDQPRLEGMPHADRRARRRHHARGALRLQVDDPPAPCGATPARRAELTVSARSCLRRG
jgi:hypothetical protein